MPDSLRPSGARSSHWYTPHNVTATADSDIEVVYHDFDIGVGSAMVTGMELTATITLRDGHGGTWWMSRTSGCSIGELTTVPVPGSRPGCPGLPLDHSLAGTGASAAPRPMFPLTSWQPTGMCRTIHHPCLAAAAVRFVPVMPWSRLRPPWVFNLCRAVSVVLLSGLGGYVER